MIGIFNAKILAFGIFFLFFTFSASAQLSKSDALDTLLSITNEVETTKNVVNNIITKLLEKNPEVPQSVREEIQSEIDYEKYGREIRAVYDDKFSGKKLNKMLTLLQEGEVEEFKKIKEKANKDLYDVGYAFGKESMQVIMAKFAEHQ